MAHQMVCPLGLVLLPYFIIQCSFQADLRSPTGGSVSLSLLRSDTKDEART
jgi:hypothetical protein